MKIEIFFQNSKLTTEIKKDVEGKDLIYELKQYLESNDSNFVLFDSEYNQLKDTDTISTKNQKHSTLYLIKPSVNKNNLNNLSKKETLNENLNINQLIMKCTGAKKALEKAAPTQQNRVNLLELIGDRNNDQGRDYFERLINLIEIFDGNNQIIIRGGPNSNNNNTQIEADEQSLRELQDMGFPEDRARQALINSRNDINRATELLLGEDAE